MYRKILFTSLAWVGSVCLAYSQPALNPRFPVTQTSFLHLGLLPGLSTNGMDAGVYENIISIQILSGVSAAQRTFEVAGLSTFTSYAVTGIQLAGIVNVVGANYLLGMSAADRRAMERNGYQPHTRAIQVAGVINLLRTPFTGFQATGGLNLVAKGVEGAQIAGVGNATGSYLIGFQGSGGFNFVKKGGLGIQLSGIFNWAKEDFDGFQIATFFNRTRYLTGLQLGLVNSCKRVEGWASDNVPRFKSAQIGLLNLTKEQNAFQFGLINIYKPGSRGVSMGLLNLGGLYWVSYYANERHHSNLEFATGNTMTKLHRGSVWRWSTYNTLGFSIGGWQGKTREISWGAGAMLEDTGAYSFRSTVRLYYPWVGKDFKNWQGLYGSWGVSAGIRPGNKMDGIQFFLSPTLNWHMFSSGELATSPRFSMPLGDRFWGGLQLGVKLG